MQDAMITARMPQQKKEAGNRILAELGTTPSQAVNGLYDYVIREKKLPYRQKEEFGLQKYTKEQIEEAMTFVKSIKISVDPRFQTMTIEEAKRERLIQRGLLEPEVAQ